MQHRDWTFQVRDILEAIATIHKYTAGLEFEDFSKDRRTVDAVIRNLIVIGEAASRIPNDVCESNLSVPWMEMFYRSKAFLCLQ